MTIAAGGYIPANILGVFTFSEMHDGLPAIIFLSIQIIFSAMLCFGAFRLTTPEPRRADIEDPVTLRRATRVASIIAAISVSAFLLLVVAEIGSMKIEGAVLTLIGASLLSVPVLLGCLFSYMIGIARRIPDIGLAKATSFVRGTFVFPFVAGGAGYALGWIGIAGPMGSIAMMSGLAGLVLVWIYWQALTDPSMRVRKR